MKIGYYSHYFTPEIGAPSARIYDLSQQWLEMGHDVEVVTGFPNHPRGELYPGYKLSRYTHDEVDDIKVHRNWTYITPNEGVLKKTLGHISFWLGSRLFSDKHLGDLDLTIGSSPTLFAAMAAWGAARRRDIPFVMEVRDLWPAVFVELGVIKAQPIIDMLEFWELWLYRKAAKVITVTESFKKNIVSRGISGEKVHVIPNGADVNYWQPMSKSENLAEKLGLQDSFIVLYIGTHGISQALSTVLDCAEVLQEKPEIQFLMVGDGAEKESLVKSARDRGISNIHFHAPVCKDKVKQFYALADVCLVPLRNIPLFETFIPSKMFEMMAMGCPIIGSLKGEAAEILDRSNGGVSIPPESSDALSRTILRLVAHRDETRRMGQSGREFVVQNYSRGRLARRYAAILCEVLG